MRIIGIIVVASAALLTGALTASAASGDGTPAITSHAFAKGIDMQAGRSATLDWADGIRDRYRFSTGFTSATSPCDTARIQALFCSDDN